MHDRRRQPGPLARAAAAIALTRANHAQRIGQLERAAELRRERALARARDGDLMVVDDGVVKVCGIDRTVLYIDAVPGWPALERWVCSTCGREKLFVEEESEVTA